MVSVGANSILATSSETLPWPNITAVSQSRFGESYNRKSVEYHNRG